MLGFKYLKKTVSLEREVVGIEPNKLTHFRYRDLKAQKVLITQIRCDHEGCGGLGSGVEILLPVTGIKNVDSHCFRCGSPLMAEVEFN